jgi:hypothetical protein
LDAADGAELRELATLYRKRPDYFVYRHLPLA